MQITLSWWMLPFVAWAVLWGVLHYLSPVVGRHFELTIVILLGWAFMAAARWL